ncbi:hypothetical protein [Fimbriiglobus ruber]|uniref:Thioredoxin domain-containing protein n=1 Tax=Fimbriiglobus ruber TaxID=1908690 RepID=A0A225E4L2_9BACT|nr:hypothetical protein [Fimbriiglobus ruber]OWK43625.1 hypothetical protein FRUB_03224 [Fimbriiglobus ruber]
MIRKLFATTAAIALVAGFAGAAELKSGPQPGEKVPGPFVPLNINGGSAGEKHCLYCENGTNPVVMIFARTPECPGTQKLIKAVDETTAKNSSCKMGSFVVFLSDEEKLDAKLKEMAEKEKLKKLVLSIDSPSGPQKYNVNKDADLTVVLYTDREVKVSHAFKKGEIKDADIEAILKDVSKILPTK